MNIYVVIPALNESKKIKEVINQIRPRYRNIVVIDDGSDDDTADIAENTGVVVLRHIINRGQGASLKTGITYALNNGADIIVTFDADGQHAVEDIQHLVKPIQEGRVEVVLGSRFLNKPSIAMPAVRKIVLRAAVFFTKIASGVNITDTHNGLRALSGRAAQTIRLNQDRMAHASEIFDEIHRHKLAYQEVPVSIHYSEYSLAKGQSSLSFGKILFKYLVGKLLR